MKFEEICKNEKQIEENRIGRKLHKQKIDGRKWNWKEPIKQKIDERKWNWKKPANIKNRWGKKWKEPLKM